MLKYSCLFLVHLHFLIVSGESIFNIEHDYKGFDDNIAFTINWPGSNELNNIIDETSHQENVVTQNKEILKVKTTNNEIYECHIPDLVDNEPINIEDYNGPTPMKLLWPLFSQQICSYRLESYWSYEVCHGRYVRQYHEEREGKQVKSQQYYLGNWDAEKQKKLVDEQVVETEQKDEKYKTTKVDGISLPYIELVMGDGSLCDLSGKPRLTRVQYVCYNHGKHEVYSFKETSTCEYEIIVLSPLLCDHPQFKPKEASENAINCIPVGDAPKKPRNLLALEAESLKINHQTVRLSNNDNDLAKDVLAVLKVEKIEKDGETHLKFELRPLNEVGDVDNTISLNKLTDKSSGNVAKAVVPDHVISDDSPVRAFLNGENCLTGGTGWWKYEFCYGKYVEQYHVDRIGARTSLLLGTFDEKTHIEWIKENKMKAPRLDERLIISHFYSNGDICDKTGKPRQTEVKLKCLENSSHSAQVSLYLLEPKTCQYILGVESPLLCDILPLADENGLVKSALPLPKKTNVVSERGDVQTDGVESVEDNTIDLIYEQVGADEADKSSDKKDEGHEKKLKSDKEKKVDD